MRATPTLLAWPLLLVALLTATHALEIDGIGALIFFPFAENAVDNCEVTLEVVAPWGTPGHQSGSNAFRSVVTYYVHKDSITYNKMLLSLINVSQVATPRVWGSCCDTRLCGIPFFLAVIAGLCR